MSIKIFLKNPIDMDDILDILRAEELITHSEKGD
jgi:hypothetical protein